MARNDKTGHSRRLLDRYPSKSRNIWKGPILMDFSKAVQAKLATIAAVLRDGDDVANEDAKLLLRIIEAARYGHIHYFDDKKRSKVMNEETWGSPSSGEERWQVQRLA
jgi:hypothetical protein